MLVPSLNHADGESADDVIRVVDLMNTVDRVCLNDNLVEDGAVTREERPVYQRDL